MKKNCFKSIFAFFAALALIATSCVQEQKAENEVKPIFPSTKVNKLVEPGTSATLAIESNLPCEISVPTETINNFWIVDNGQPVSKLSFAQAGTHVVTIMSAEAVYLDTAPFCDVTMTMGGQSKVIATVALVSIPRFFNVYPAQIDESGNYVKKDGAYVYAQSPVKELNMNLTADYGTNFELPVKVVSNFPWTLTWPEWILADVQATGEAGASEFVITANPATYPVAGATEPILVKDGDLELEKLSHTLSVEAVHGLIYFTRAAFPFNADGTSTPELGGEPIEGGLVTQMMSTQGARIYVFDWNENGYFNTQAPTWVNINAAEWDEDGSRIQTRQVTVSVTENTGKERNAAIFFVPEQLAADPDFNPAEHLFTTDGSQVNPQFASLAAMLTQSGVQVVEDIFTLLSGSAKLEEDGGPSSDWFKKEYGMSKMYTLTFNKDTESAILSYAKMDKLAAYDATDDEDNPLGDNPWIMLEPSDGNLVVYMGGEEEQKGYVYLKDSEGNVLDVLYCIYSPDATLGEDASLFTWAYPEYVKGAELVACPDEIWEMEGGPFLEFIQAGLSQSKAYILTYNIAQPQMALINVALGVEPTFIWEESPWLTYEWQGENQMYVDMSETGDYDFLVWRNANYTYDAVLLCMPAF